MKRLFLSYLLTASKKMPKFSSVAVIAALCLLAIITSGCGVRQESVPQALRQTKSKKFSGEKQEQSKEAVKVRWKKSSVAQVDGFKLTYGFRTNQLDKTLILPVSGLKSASNNQGDTVYEYTLGPIQPEQEIYFFLTSYRDSESGQLDSIPTQVFSSKR